MKIELLILIPRIEFKALDIVLCMWSDSKVCQRKEITHKICKIIYMYIITQQKFIPIEYMSHVHEYSLLFICKI